MAVDRVKEFLDEQPVLVVISGESRVDNKKYQVEVCLDISLKQYETVFPAAGSGNSAVETTMEQMEKYTGFKEWVDVCQEKGE